MMTLSDKKLYSLFITNHSQTENLLEHDEEINDDIINVERKLQNE
jgi:hypothetical protein